MKTETLINLNKLNKDNQSADNEKTIDLIFTIINYADKMRKNGINYLESYTSNQYPLFKKGLELITYGLEPDKIEFIIMNYIIWNDFPVRESSIILEGILLIQQLEHPFIVKEILYSFIGFNNINKYVKKYEVFKTQNNIEDSIKLSKNEVDELLSKFK